MTVTFTAVRPHTSCPSGTTSSTSPNIIAIDLSATRTTTTDPEFTSPFRSFPWSAATADNQIVDVDASDPCVSDSAQLRFMESDSVPGTTTTGTIYVSTADTANRLVSEPNHQGPYIVPVP